MELIFYDKDGTPTAYTLNDDIYLFNGKPVAYIYNQSYIYSIKGKHLGFFDNGYIIDIDGNYVFFTDNSVGGIVKPAKRCTPSRSARMPYPIKLTREIPRIRPVKKLNWSNKSNISFWE